MAPEIPNLEGKKEGHGTKADIWSFGITALEIAFGMPPFAKQKLGEVMRNVQAGQTHAWMKEAFKSKQHVLSPKFKDLVEKCLQTNPKDRPTAENLLKHNSFKSMHEPRNGYGTTS